MCRKYSAQEALEMGLINKVVPLDQLEDEVVDWAKTIMNHSALAIRMIKAGLNAELDGQGRHSGSSPGTPRCSTT